MKCPHCQREIAETWQSLKQDSNEFVHGIGPSSHLPQRLNESQGYMEVLWMVCPAAACNETIIQVVQYVYEFRDDTDRLVTDKWFAHPRRSLPRPIDDVVPEEFKRDYVEASLILEDSPRMSAVLARRILADLLERYAKRDERRLDDRIDKFTRDTAHPPRLRENLDYLREMGNFGAHTMRSDNGEIVNVSLEEAEWTLSVLDGLFDYFIVSPARDADRRASFEEKLKKAGRNPIQRLPEDGNDP